MFRRVLLSALRITLVVVAVFAVLWWFGVKMPGKNISAAAALSKEDVDLRAELKADVEKLAGEIGERNMLRYAACVSEAPRYFQTSQMGIFVYASRCKAHGDKISAMISLETIGYFSDAPRSQTYPSPGLGIFYPTVGNFIGFVGNTHSRVLLRRVMSIFRAQEKIPSEGAALPAFIPGVAWSDQWSFWNHGNPAS